MIPRSITLDPGEQEIISKTIDDFFIETKQLIEQSERTDPHDFEIRSGEIAYLPEQVTDDRITYLLFRKEVVACILETRTEFNYAHYDFFRNLRKDGR